jgi:hypothetical protein
MHSVTWISTVDLATDSAWLAGKRHRRFIHVYAAVEVLAIQSATISPHERGKRHLERRGRAGTCEITMPML